MGWVYTDYIAPYLPEAAARKLHTWPPTAIGQKKIRYNLQRSKYLDKSRIATAHGSLNRMRQVAPTCNSSDNNDSFGPH